MDAFERNKFNSVEFIKLMLAESVVVSYGFISAVDFDSVVVTMAVSDKPTPDKVRCTFMNLGDEFLLISRKPYLGMRVLVFSPNKSAEGMYESYSQLNINEGRNYIFTDTPAVYSSQFALCIPMMKSTAQSLNTLFVDKDLLSAKFSTELLIAFESSFEIDFKGDTSVELHEGTENFRGCYGNMEQTFGVLPGINGVEKSGTYEYKETYGKYSKAEKNYEGALDIIVGKAYEKPFLTDKGNLVDSSAPVTMEFGGKAPVTLTFGDTVDSTFKKDVTATFKSDLNTTFEEPITLNNKAPMNLVFGESVVTITADDTNGIDIALTGSTKVNISAATGKFSIKNDSGSLKDILDKIADLCAGITTIGPNVVPGSPYAAAVDPATIARFSGELKTLIASILE